MPLRTTPPQTLDPDAAGLAVPGMPIGSPGMETPGRRPDRYEVLLVQNGDATGFTRH